MKSKDQVRLSTVRMILSETKYKEIEKGGPLEEEELAALLGQMVKKRREAAEQYEKGERRELAEKELAEAEVLKGYLPQELSEEELAGLIDAEIAALGAAGPKDMGRLMKSLMPKLAGRADGRRVSEMVKARLV